jgi:hypothetical protein
VAQRQAIINQGSASVVGQFQNDFINSILRLFT